MKLEDKNFIISIWDKLELDLQDALALAFNRSREDGEKLIRTKYVFAAIHRLKPEELMQFIALLPEEALEPRLSSSITTESHLLKEKLELSNCVSDSLHELSKRAPANRKITTTDIYVDLAKYGTGSSVRKLRDHGIDKKEIDEKVKTAGLKPLSRDWVITLVIEQIIKSPFSIIVIVVATIIVTMLALQ